jgi:hypothetical protein
LDDRERLAKMIARGERELEAANVSSARQFFLRAAEGGLARGAILLAWTYDEAEFVRLRIQGVTPNREFADKWYKRMKAGFFYFGVLSGRRRAGGLEYFNFNQNQPR